MFSENDRVLVMKKFKGTLLKKFTPTSWVVYIDKLGLSLPIEEKNMEKI